MSQLPIFEDLQLENTILRAENARLRRDLEIWKRNGGDDLQRAEVERLQNDLERRLRQFDAHIQAADGVIKQLRAEKARLLAALDEIDAHCPRDDIGWTGLCFNDIREIMEDARTAIKSVGQCND